MREGTCMAVLCHTRAQIGTCSMSSSSAASTAARSSRSRRIWSGETSSNTGAPGPPVCALCAVCCGGDSGRASGAALAPFGGALGRSRIRTGFLHAVQPCMMPMHEDLHA